MRAWKSSSSINRGDHGMTLHLIGEAFNISNHQNVTGVCRPRLIRCLPTLV